METVTKYVLQRRAVPGSGEWADAGIAMEKLEWAEQAMKKFSDCWPEQEFRMMEKTVITIYKPVK